MSNSTIQGIIESRKREVATVKLSDKVSDTVRFFSEKKCKAAVVVDGKQTLCGIVTEHDLVRCLGGRGKGASGDIIDNIMSLDLVVCTPESTVFEAMGLMSQHKIHHLPVVNKTGSLVGFVDIMEVMMNYIDPMEK